MPSRALNDLDDILRSGECRARRAVDGNMKEVELAATGNSTARPQQRDVKAGVLATEPEEARQGKPDLEAAEPSRPADVAHLEIPRASKWRGRCFLCICIHT